MLVLDHLVIIAPNLAEGEAYVREALGVEMTSGGAHPKMGTHNRLLRLGEDLFLEVIAIDPAAPKPPHARWFALDDEAATQTRWNSGLRLGAYVARTDDLDAVLAKDSSLGQAQEISRGDRTWRFGVTAQGERPEGGALPYCIDWGARATAAFDMPDKGCRLASFTLFHPEPERIKTRFAALGFANPPRLVKAAQQALSAEIETPHGTRILK